MFLSNSEVLIIGDDEIASFMSFNLLSPSTPMYKFVKPKIANIYSFPQCKFDAAIQLANKYLHEKVDLLIIFPFLWEYLEKSKRSKRSRMKIINKALPNTSEGLIKKVNTIISDWKEKFPNLIVFWCLPFIPFFEDMNEGEDYLKAKSLHLELQNLFSGLCSAVTDVNVVNLHWCFFEKESTLKKCLTRKPFLYPPPAKYIKHVLEPSKYFVRNFHLIIYDKFNMIKSSLSKKDDILHNSSPHLLWFDKTKNSYQETRNIKVFDYAHSSSCHKYENLTSYDMQSQGNQFSTENQMNVSSTSLVSNLSSGYLKNIKDALNFINKSVLNSHISNFFDTNERKDMFLKGGSEETQNAIFQYVYHLGKKRDCKGLQVIVVMMDRNFINATEEKLMSSAQLSVGVNGHYVPDAPVILINTPAYLMQVINQKPAFSQLHSLSAIIVFGDILLHGQHSAHRQFLQLVFYIFSKVKAADLNKIIISESGTHEVRMAATKVLKAEFVSPNVDQGFKETGTTMNKPCLFPSGSHGSSALPSPYSEVGSSDLTIPLILNKERRPRRQCLFDVPSADHREKNQVSRSHSRTKRLTIDMEEDFSRRKLSPETSDELPLSIFTLAHSYIPTKERKEDDKENEDFRNFLKVVGRSVEKEYMIAGRKLLSEHEDNYKVYVSTSEIHPEYEEHYEVFAKEYEAHFGKFCDVEKMQDAWLIFWKIIVDQIKEKAWVAIKKSLQESLYSKYKEKHDAILDLKAKYQNKGKRKAFDERSCERDKLYTATKTSRYDTAGSSHNGETSKVNRPSDQAANGAQELNSKNRSKIVFKVENPKAVSQFDLKEVLDDIKIVCEDLGVLRPVFEALLQQSRDLLVFNPEKAVALFNEQDNQLLLDIIAAKLNSFFDSCSLTEKSKYRKAIAAITNLINQTKKGSSDLPAEELDVIAIAKATYGLTTEETYTYIKNACSERVLRSNGEEELFKEISLIHFKMATEM